MKAISPVIATLILIAIAVIAGIFVLRQFLLFAGTSGTQNILSIQDAILIVKHNATNYANKTVTLQISVKNQGDKVASITYIKVDGIVVFNATAAGSPIRLNPGQVHSGSYKVFAGIDTAGQWEAGTEHIVTVTYQILGQAGEQTISQKITVQ